MRRFVKFPFDLYSGNKYWIPPLIHMELRELDPKVNPIFEQAEAAFFLAYRGDKIVGRIAAMAHLGDTDRKGRFGWFDVIDDQDVAQELLFSAEEWLKNKNFEYVEGPVGFTNLDKAGCLIDGFDQLGNITTIYNYPYYQKLLLGAGYEPYTDWLEFRISVPKNTPDRLHRFSELVSKRLGLKIIPTKTNEDVIKYADAIFELLNKTHQNLHGFVAVSPRMAKYYQKRFASFLQADYTSIIVDERDKLVAFGLSIPSMSRAFRKANGRLLPLGWWHIRQAIKNNDTADLMLIGVDPIYQKKGVPALIFFDFSKGLIKRGIRWLESNPELADNKDVQMLWGKYEHVQHKQRRSFIKTLT